MFDDDEDEDLLKLATEVTDTCYDTLMQVLSDSPHSDDDVATAAILGLTEVLLDCVHDVGTGKQQFLTYMGIMFERARNGPEQKINAGGGTA